ncbi:hypothetical protein HDZ31DRAFT_82090 [Schizophyllum fasciatum]
MHQEHATQLTDSRTSPKLALLPVEILDHVAQHLALRDKLALAASSPHFNDLCTRLIYRSVDWTSWPQTLRCCRTLLARPRIAQAVRSLSISLESSPPPLLQAAYRTLSAALQRLERLRTLYVVAPHDAYFSIVLAPCRFNHLVNLTLSLPIPRAFSAFLARHDDLRALQIHPSAYAHDFTSVPFIALPALRTLVAPQLWLPKLVGSASQLEYVAIIWDPRVPGDPRALLAALGAPTTIVSISHGWRLDVVNAVADTHPGLVSLILRSSDLSEDTKPLLDALSNNLPQWKRLTHLDVSFDVEPSREPTKPPTEAALEAGFGAVTRLGSLCPSLLHCSLPGTCLVPTPGEHAPDMDSLYARVGKSTWTRPVLHENAWFPQVSPALKYKFITMGIFTGRYPPAILASAGIMTEAQTESLKDDVEQLRETGLTVRQIAEMVTSLMLSKRQRW